MTRPRRCLRSCVVLVFSTPAVKVGKEKKNKGVEFTLQTGGIGTSGRKRVSTAAPADNA